MHKSFAPWTALVFAVSTAALSVSAGGCAAEPSEPPGGAGGASSGAAGAGVTGGVSGNGGRGGEPAGTGGSETAGSSSGGAGSGGAASTGGAAGIGGTETGGAGAMGGMAGAGANFGGTPDAGTGGIGGAAGGGGSSVMGGSSGAASLGGRGGAAGSGTGLPETGTEGDGDSMVGPTYTSQSDLSSKGNPKGKSFQVSVTSMIFNGRDTTLTKTPVNVTRTVQIYVPAAYRDGAPAPVLLIQDGPGQLSQVSNALDNLTISPDATRKLPAFVVIAVPSGGNDSIGSERGLEYDTLSDRYARYITQEVMPAVQNTVKGMYPNFKYDPNPSGRAALGCSSGAAAAFTMAWFRPDLFSRVIAYSTTLVAQQDPAAPETTMYPHGAWDYHSDRELIKNDTMGREKLMRVFHNANENDNGSTAAESGRHNWLLANQKTAAALKAKGYHYKYVYGLGQGHCSGSVISATLADALVWVWRGYQQPAM